MATYKEKLLTDVDKNPISPIASSDTVYNGYGNTTLRLSTYLNSVTIDMASDRILFNQELDTRPSGNSGRYIINLNFDDPETVIITDTTDKLGAGQYLLINLPPQTSNSDGTYTYYNGKQFKIIAAAEYAENIYVNMDALNTMVDIDITQPCVTPFLLQNHIMSFVCNSTPISNASQHWEVTNGGLKRSDEITSTPLSAELESQVPSVAAVRKYVNERQTGVTQAEYNQMVATGRVDPAIIYIIKY